MRRSCLVVAFLLVCSLAVVVRADYMNPPGWENDPYFTHQSWSFDAKDNPALPDDGGAGNSYGDPILQFENAVWVDDLGMVYDPATFEPLGQRQGGFSISGPQDGTTWFTVDLPNEAAPGMTKEVWFEMTFRVSDMQLAGVIQNVVNLSVYADGIMDGEHAFEYFDEQGGVIGVSALGEIWLRFEGKFSYTPQPQSELMVLTGSLEPGQSVCLDQIDIDTHCIPEPGTLGLLAIGAVGLLRRRR